MAFDFSIDLEAIFNTISTLLFKFLILIPYQIWNNLPIYVKIPVIGILLFLMILIIRWVKKNKEEWRKVYRI